MKRIGIIHYDDIALKGANRNAFELQLVKNIARRFAVLQVPFVVEQRWGRIVVSARENIEWKPEMETVLRTVLRQTPGVAVFGIGFSVEPQDAQIEQAAHTVCTHDIPSDTETFCIRTTRVDKNFPGTSQEIDVRLGSIAFNAFEGKKKVKLTHPDSMIRVEILPNAAFVYIKEEGVGGLAVGSSGKAVSLLSGGFDSPVATYMCATRGVVPLLLHFHSYPQTSQRALDKVEDLAHALVPYCGPLKIGFAPLLDAQKTIALTAPEKLRVVLYRRVMMRVAERWAQKHGAHALITGDSIGQVASQTLENIAAVEHAVVMPVLRPLSGMHKRAIIDIAQKIGTYDISALPHDDTCTVFMPRRPETKARIEQVLQAESMYDVDGIVDAILERIDERMIP